LHVVAKDTQFALERPLEYPHHHNFSSKFGNNDNVDGYPKLEYDDNEGAMVQEKIINILTQAGADTEIEDVDGETPIAVAMSAGNNHVVQYLLENGASPMITTAAGDNIFHYLLASFEKIDMAVWREIDNVIKTRLEKRRQRIWNLLITKHASKTLALKSLVRLISSMYLEVRMNIPNIQLLGECFQR
jgi:ankyrin repeat protein